MCVCPGDCEGGPECLDDEGGPVPASPITVYASIGNSDDKLPQQRWHDFWVRFRLAVIGAASRVHGEWLSIGCAPYQNGCVCFEVEPAKAGGLKAELARLAAEFGQDSIAWAVAVTEFIGPEAGRLRGRGRR
jgi:hypothetical protein